ncbi:alpha-amylase family protein [Microvirga roseola]|uniref:alpha-amylase family protein n=1 Tax=Microvirga roseola TaxID=2883126 RepID=UPI001E5FE2C3|nr:alpha-amylase family protein [Microvirga roseola]
MLDLWYKNAIVYCLDVGTFRDSCGTGVGDFQGLANRLDHIEALGVNCLWLLPFYESPNRDNGYDVSDYYSVDSAHGSLGDFVSFMHAASDRGLRVILDLVANHTSIDHPWFQEARRNPDSVYRDWYIWSKEKPEDPHEGMIFPGMQKSTWTYDEVAGAWYFHRFFDFQPDLNIANPAVKEEIDKIMGFWLQLGASGFRLDAVPFLIEFKGLEEEERPDHDPHHYLTELRTFLAWRKSRAILLGEANISFDHATDYFGSGGDRIQIIFNFVLNQNMFLALSRRDAEPIRKALSQMPELPETAQWANFLRNHDELDLARLSDSERQEVFEAFAPDPSMQIFGRGIRRRLAPMLGNERRIKMAYSLMFAMPGTPVLWYGEEIGMGEDLSLPERNSVRTPMQWDDGPNAGFSSASSDKLLRPVINDGPYSYRKVNAASQHDKPGSIMEHIQRLIRTRRSCPEVGWGNWTVLPTSETSVLALRYRWRGNTLVVLHNLDDRCVETKIDWEGEQARLVPMFCDTDDRTARSALDPITMNPYGFLWMRVMTDDDKPGQEPSGTGHA